MVLLESISAITSWESYEYQGHMALYVALERIFYLINKKESIEDYDLQIEGEEDFSIRKDNNYITLHQVKAGSINLEANDKFAFIIGILQNKAEYGYFHITSGRKLCKDFVSSTLKYIDVLEKDLEKEVKKRKDISDNEKEENFIIIENISRNHKKASLYSIIKYVSKNSRDVNEIISAISQIRASLKEYKNIIETKVNNGKKTNKSLSDDEVFLDVFKERYNNTKEIRKKAYEIISEILKKLRPEYTFVNIDYSALVYDCLFLYMKEKITDFNENKNNKEKCILTFNDIVEQLTEDHHKKIDSISYQYFQVLRSIRDAYAEYPRDTLSSCKEINCKSCNDSSNCNLFNQMNILNNKSEEDKNRIIHNLLLKTPKVGKSNNLPHDNLISNLFLNLLDEIKELRLRKNNSYEAIVDKNKVYRLTLDSSYSINEFQRSLMEELKKDIDKTLLYECDVLITDRLCEENLLFNGGNINILNEKQLNEIKEITDFSFEDIKKDYNRTKVIRLINKEKALGEIK